MSRIFNNMNIDELINELINDEVVDMKNPSCNNCNECCSILSLITEEEYKNLKKFLTKDKEGKIAYREAKKRYKKLKEKADIVLVCPFSNKSKKCSIYSHRPKICRDFHCGNYNPDIKKDYNESDKMNLSLFFKE